jgi:hypothetical protein
MSLDRYLLIKSVSKGELIKSLLIKSGKIIFLQNVLDLLIDFIKDRWGVLLL